MITVILSALLLRIAFALTLPLDGGDETYQLLSSQKPIKPLLEATLNASGPAWTLILHFLEKLTTNYQIIRIITALIGTLSIVIASKIGTTLFSKKVGLLTALAFALSPTQIYFSAHSRQYSLTIFTSLLIFLALTKFLKSPKKNILFLGFVLTEANYVHYLAPLISISFMIFLLVARKYQELLKFTRIFLISSLASLPLYYLWLNVEHVPKTGLPEVSLVKIAALPIHFTFPLNLAQLTDFYPKLDLNYANLLLLSLSFFTLALVAIKVVKKPDVKISFLLSTMVISNLIVILASALGYSIFGYRTLLIFATPFYILLGLALASSKKLTAIYLFLTAITLVSIIYYFQNKPYPLEDFLKNNLKSGDILINTEFTNYTYLKYLMPDLEHKAAIDTLYKTEADKKLFEYYPVDTKTLNNQSFWFLEQPTLIHKIMVEDLKNKLNSTHQIVSKQSFDDITVYKYEPR